jgi:curved DNA-binding protein
LSDYYKTLGVTKGTPGPDIKKAYRKLAMEHHPDQNKGDPKAEAKFKEISEAYAVLSDDKKRQQYDMYGSSDFSQKYSRDDIFRGTDFNSVFNEFGFGQSTGGGMGDIFSHMFGGQQGGMGGGGFNQGFGGRPPKGQDVEYEITIGFNEAFSGSEREVSFSLTDGSSQSMKVKVPAGIKDGGKLRVQGKGAPSRHGGASGDLYVIVRVSPHPDFVRVEQNIEVLLPLKITEALLGCTKEVPTLDGAKKLKIPAGVKPGTKIRLRGLGFPKLAKVPQGDLFAVIEYDVPKELSEAQVEAINTLQELDL